jgi:hypothetical protein
VAEITTIPAAETLTTPVVAAAITMAAAVITIMAAAADLTDMAEAGFPGTRTHLLSAVPSTAAGVVVVAAAAKVARGGLWSRETFRWAQTK